MRTTVVALLKFSFYLFLGALTSKPYAFKARSWEFSLVDSLDVHDSIGSSVSLSIRDNFIYRVLPKLNEGVNGAWISDRVRFSYDGFRNQRIVAIFYPNLLHSSQTRSRFASIMPLFCKFESQYKQTVDWKFALDLFKSTAFRFKNFNFFLSNSIDYETLSTLKTVADRPAFGSGNFFYLSNRNWFPGSFDFRAMYFCPNFNSFAEFDFFLFVGANLRVEAPILNIHIRKITKSRGRRSDIFFLGCDFNSNLNYVSLGNSARTFQEILEGRHSLCARLLFSKKPVFVFGRGVLYRADCFSIQGALAFFKAKFMPRLRSIFLYEGGAWLGAFELGLFQNFPVPVGGPRMSYFFNYNDRELSRPTYNLGVYLGQHFGIFNHRASPFVFPTSAIYEKNSTHINLEGGYRSAFFGYSPPIACRLDWKAVIMLFDSGWSMEYGNWEIFESARNLFAFAMETYGGGGLDSNVDFCDPFELVYFKVGRFRFFDSPFLPFTFNFYTKGSPNSRVMGVSSARLDSELRPQFRLKGKLLNW